MANIKAYNNDYVRFYIESDLFGRNLMAVEPGGWSDDILELDRSSEHGIFNKFTNNLYFYKDDKDLIENTFQELGNNSSVYIIKEELEDVDGVVQFTEKYRGRADWETKSIKDNILQIKFNSSELEDLIKANQSDDFEIGSLKTIDDESMEPLETYNLTLQGRELVSYSQAIINPEDENEWIEVNYQNGIFGDFMKTKIISQGFDRHASVDVNNFNEIEASMMFFVDSTAIEPEQEIELEIDLDFDYYYYFFGSGNEPTIIDQANVKISLLKIRRNYVDENDQIGEYVIQEEIILYEGITSALLGNHDTLTDSYTASTNVQWNEGLMLRIRIYPDQLNPVLSAFTTFKKYFRVRTHNIKFNASSYVEPSVDLKTIFVHDAINRLLNIISNKSDLLYSKYFGRTELGYNTDGEGGLISLVNGYWLRAFDEGSEKYKTPVLSLQDLLDSCNALFNTGMGTQLINNKRVVRVESVKYFYQPTTVVHLGNASNVERKYDSSLYFSGLTFGQSKGGNYENEVGLDEPNIETSYTTPDRKSDKKYRKISKVRVDETEMEIVRRKPQLLFPEEDTNSDDDNWFLDLKRIASGYTQKNWDDRLSELPDGINKPASFRSMFFTPLRMLFRHGWIIRSGLETYLNRKINFASSRANSNLETHFIDEPSAYREDLPDGLEVGVLERARMLPELITFNAVINKDILNQIYGTTRALYQGDYEDIPNYYFKFSWINENGDLEEGYLMNMKPEGIGKFTMQKANNRPL